MQVNLDTKKRKQVINDICKSLDVVYESGELKLNLRQKLDTLPQAMVRLSQACIRLSDLALTQKIRAVGSFKDEIEDFIIFNGFDYQPQFKLPGDFGREVEVDFMVQGNKLNSLILTLSTGSSQAAHGLSNEVMTRWYDIINRKQEFQFLTLFDSTNDVFREADLNRLSSLSTVLAFPANQDEVREILAA